MVAGETAMDKESAKIARDTGHTQRRPGTGMRIKNRGEADKTET